MAWVNDYCLGRYWPDVGPQVTLYVPHGILRQGSNTLLLLELEAAPCLAAGMCQVVLQQTHQLDGPTPHLDRNYSDLNDIPIMSDIMM